MASPLIASARLKLLRELGQGANSVVYRAELDGKPCALKLPRSKGTWTRWVYREAVALARVRDPRLPAVLEVGEVDGLPFLAMELVEGETLAARLRRAPPSRDETIEIASTVLRALESVHEAGLIHRDVKPKNLIVGADGRVRLVDFGFAMPIERGAESDPELAGTPAYAAPEQLRAPARLDGRADLYALGVVIVECLTGRLLQRGERVEPVATIGDTLAAFLGGLVAADPELRYPSARAALADLERVRTSRAPLGPSAYPPPSPRAPVVGREVELSRILDAFASARLAGTVVVVRGGRGAGKSRLLAAAADAWSEAGRLRMLATSCHEGDAPWAALRRLFDAYLAALRRAPSPDRAALEEALTRAAEGHLGGLAALVSPAMGELLGTRGDASVPASVAEGLSELLIRLFRRVGPVLVTVDDLQWIDAPSREVLVRVAHRAQEVPLVLLLATRVDATGETPVERFRAAELPRAAIVDIAELDRRDAAKLVALHLGAPAVSQDTLDQVAALGDGTPLGVLEVLGAMLDTGALRLENGTWQLDRRRAEHAALPARSFELLGRRVDGLPPASARVVEQASVLGQVFEDQLLAEVLEIPLEDLGYALADARRACVLVADGADGHRFVHDGIREIVLARLGHAAVRGLHQRAAEALMRRPVGSLQDLYATAMHYAAGDPDAAPAEGYAACRLAATAALESFDNEGALRFLALAESAGKRARIAPDEAHFRAVGEAQLRVGSLAESAAAFERALDLAVSPKSRAEILGRIAWVHQTAADPEQAWARLQQAFRALEQDMPIESARSAGATLGQLARLGMRAVSPKREWAERVEPENIGVLCDLHYQNARLALEYGKPARLIQSTVQALELSARLGPSRARARTLAMKGFVVTALGGKETGGGELAAARQMAASISDPVSEAFALQLRATAGCFSGAFDDAIRDLKEVLVHRGHWLELGEFCLTLLNADLIESMRGRVHESTAWIDKALSRALRSERRTAVFDQMLLHRARASRASAGRSLDDLPVPKEPRGFFRLVSWGARARVFVERGDLGPEFEAFVREFEAEGIRARGSHPVLAEYYITIAHARAHQCLRATPGERASCVVLLRKAVEDLGHAVKAPLFRAHHLLLEAYLAHFTQAREDVSRKLAKAELLAREETCPWVLYGAARLRAHGLAASGRADAALDEARIAEALAVQHGAVNRARWIREELGLPEPATPRVEHELSSRGSSAGSRYLAALVDLSKPASSELALVPRAASILDELLRDVDATRGFVWLAPCGVDLPPTVVGRVRDGSAVDSAGDRLDALLGAVTRTGTSWPEPEDASVTVRAAAPWIPDLDPRRSMALPLVFGDRTIGALYLERAADRAPLSPATRRMLSALASQVALALELARVLEERERLQRSLQHAQKMEAVGRLAGGVAHDINNMLSVTQLALDKLRRSTFDTSAAEEVGMLVEGTERAKHLVQQLLTFSRARGGAKARVHLHEVITRNQALIRTLLGKTVNLELSLQASSAVLVAELALLEQSLLVPLDDLWARGVNARLT